MGVAVVGVGLAAVAVLLLIVVAIVAAVGASKKGPMPTVGEESYFDGNTWQLIGYHLLATLLCTVTLGIAYPWTLCMLQKWETKHTVIHGRRLKFNGRGGQLIGRWILWVFLTVITFGIYAIWLGLGVKKWVVKHTVYADEDTPVDSYFSGGAGGYLGIHILAVLLTVVTFGIGKAWADKSILAWEARHTHIGGSPLVFDGTGGQLFGKYLLLVLLTPLTLGIYALFFPVSLLKWQIKHTEAVYQTPAIQAKARAHAQTAVQDFAKFRLAANDQEIAMMKSGYTGKEDAETLVRMAEEGNPFAAYDLALREKGEAPCFEGRALELLHAAAAGKSHFALFDLARQLLPAEALPMLAEAAQNGNAGATWLLAVEYRKQGRLVESAYWFRVALEWAHPQAIAQEAEYEKLVKEIALQFAEGMSASHKGSAVGAVIGGIVGAILLLALAFGAMAVLGLRTVDVRPGKVPAVRPLENDNSDTAYIYDIGYVRTDVDEDDFEEFYDVIRGYPETWEYSDSFVASEMDAETLVCWYLFDGTVQSGLYESFFDLGSEYVVDPYNSFESMFGGTEERERCRYNAADVDWALKAIFNKEAEHFEYEGEDCSHYYEDEYFYREVMELYAGAGQTFVHDFDATYEAVGNDTYRITMDLTTQWEYSDEPPCDYSWEFEVVPMHSRDQGDYWRILSFTQK